MYELMAGQYPQDGRLWRFWIIGNYQTIEEAQAAFAVEREKTGFEHPDYPEFGRILDQNKENVSQVTGWELIWFKPER